MIYFHEAQREIYMKEVQDLRILIFEIHLVRDSIRQPRLAVKIPHATPMPTLQTFSLNLG